MATLTKAQRGHFCWLLIDGVSELVRVRNTDDREERARVIDADGVWHDTEVVALKPADAHDIQEALRVHDQNGQKQMDWLSVRFIIAGHHGIDLGKALDETCWCYIQGETFPGHPLGMWFQVAHAGAGGNTNLIVGNRVAKLKKRGSSVWAIVEGESHAQQAEKWRPKRTPLAKLRGRWLK